MDTSRFQGLRFDHIRTQELALLVRCAEKAGYGTALHTLAYRAELRRRADEAIAATREG